MTGDGDALSIGGNHLIHALRRNVPVKILLFNNQIYGLTKGQASPTSELGKITKSTPFGVADHPFNPVALALGADASFVARTIDRDRAHLTEVLRAAAEHPGAALVEIYQNCPVFNDGAFAALTDKALAGSNQIRLRGRGSRSASGPRASAAWRWRPTADCRSSRWPSVGEAALLVHDPARPDPSLAFALARLASDPSGPTPIGIFRDVERAGLRARAPRSPPSRPGRPSSRRCCTPARPGPSPSLQPRRPSPSEVRLRGRPRARGGGRRPPRPGGRPRG